MSRLPRSDRQLQSLGVDDLAGLSVRRRSVAAYAQQRGSSDHRQRRRRRCDRRHQQGVSVADLAARTGIDVSQISDLEAGRFDPTYDVMIALADGMGVRLSAVVPRD